MYVRDILTFKTLFNILYFFLDYESSFKNQDFKIIV